MKDAGKIAAAIEIIEDFETRRVPLKTCLADWGRSHRFAGSKDRAWISGLALDVLRQQGRLKAQMGDTARGQVLGALRLIWDWPLDDIQTHASEQPHGPGAVSAEEQAQLEAISGEAQQTLDCPQWLSPMLHRAFGDDTTAQVAAMASRAPVDLRVNTLKASMEKAQKALAQFEPQEIDGIPNALRLPVPPAHLRVPNVISAPAYQKGWVEVQDAGSQLAALAAGDIGGAQVLDFCAGGGGKTLALAAEMQNKGQIFAYDKDARRLAPIFDRAKRAGVRNMQVRSPAENQGDMSDLEGKMDVVFIDAPCSGSGTWRRHPDTKWRLTEQQLETRLKEQTEVLGQAAKYVKPGGRLVYATCSVFIEENEDQLEAFLQDNEAFKVGPLPEAISARGLASDYGTRLTPLTSGTDGFFISVLVKT